MSDEAEKPIPKVVRWFGYGLPGHHTTVEICELSDGNLSVALVTQRDGMEPLATRITLVPRTIDLLTNALTSASHGTAPWRNVNA